jgi:hypothetical protein
MDMKQHSAHIGNGKGICSHPPSTTLNTASHNLEHWEFGLSIEEITKQELKRTAEPWPWEDPSRYPNFSRQQAYPLILDPKSSTHTLRKWLMN